MGLSPLTVGLLILSRVVLLVLTPGQFLFDARHDKFSVLGC